MSRECSICGREIDIDLVGSQEAAALAGISRKAFTMTASRGKAPEPIATLSCGPIWTRSQIEQWAANRYARRPS